MGLSIKEIIEKIAKGDEEMYSVIATVDEVDEDERTCTCSPIDNSAQLFDVKLQAGNGATTGLVQIPKENSQVVITFLSKDTAFVSLAVEVDKVLLDCDEITFNGGDNGGLIVIQSLIDRLNVIENKHNDLVNALSSRTWVTTATISASAVVGVITASPLVNVSISPTTQKSDLENDKIKH